MTAHVRSQKRREGAGTKLQKEPTGYKNIKRISNNSTDAKKKCYKNGRRSDSRMDGDGGRKLIRGTSRPSNNDDVGVIYKGKNTY